MSLFKVIKKLLTYTEPINPEGFELLEGKNEGIDLENPHKYPTSANGDRGNKSQDSTDVNNDNSNKSIDNQKEKRLRGKKTPLTVDEWKATKSQENNTQTKKQQNQQIAGKSVSKELQENLEKIKKEFNIPVNQDIVIRKFKIARKIDAALIFVDGMVDKIIINDFILRQLMPPDHFTDCKEECPMSYIEESVLSINQVTRLNEYDQIIPQILNGLTGLFIQGCEECLLIESRGYEKRSVEKPATENVIMGAQEGFTENLRTNLTLIRKIVKNKNLVTEILPVGKTSHGNCGIVYLDGIANPDIIREVKRRIESLDTDFVSGSGMLEELISDNPYMIFPYILTTERPDRSASLIMDGRVLIIFDGSPFASSVPASFFEAIQSPEDFFLKWQFASALRIIRLLGLLFTLFLPGLYIALTLFHQEMVPTELLTSIAKSRQNVPFPTIIEILMMEVSFELIREAGIRVPGAIGTTLGIIGALILGQAAVSAQIVSPVLIIVVAVTGIGSFAIPTYALSFAIRLIRFIFILFGAIAGFYGISAGILILGGIACSMKSFGVPYFSPISPKTKSNLDIIVSAPISKHKQRPDYINPLNRKRQGDITQGWKKKRGDDQE
ncbi:MAG: spore germination protein [Actinobacteria bacterium]|nr:spore germination protein [Actinomycetota bacterium]